MPLLLLPLPRPGELLLCLGPKAVAKHCNCLEYCRRALPCPASSVRDGHKNEEAAGGRQQRATRLYLLSGLPL
jgi:hypothetical protein